MDIQIRQKDIKQIQKSPVLQQTAFWAEVKKTWRVCPGF